MVRTVLQLLLQSAVAGAKAIAVLTLAVFRLLYGKHQSAKAFRKALDHNNVPPQLAKRLTRKYAAGQNEILSMMLSRKIVGKTKLPALFN